ncbi:isochorismatase [Dehalogenimonas sp. WBC-2]|nr:isochorismatase [Dehalogenimonas sp. WBC-2]
MLRIDDTLLVVIDVQEKLFRVIPDKDILLAHLQKLIRGCAILEIPVIVTEQNPAGLGATVAELAGLLSDSSRITKFTFSCCAESSFMDQLAATGRKQILICGIESHICVFQTTSDLLSQGYETHVITDCVASRTHDNKELALNRLNAEGAKLTGVEMALFELLRTAKAEQFKSISSLIK